MDGDYLGLWVFIGLCFVAAMSGAIFPPGAWHRSLAKPSWHPPNWLFGPAWMVLYAMIAVAGWLVWKQAGSFAAASTALTLWGVQLVLNAAWSGIFFGLKRMGWAFVEVLFLWASILATIIAFWPIHTGAALMMVPYLAWVTFAAALNFSMWSLNRDRPVPVAGE
ncbi:TspO/MBR family protein [Alsobacter sp. R-9]